MCFLFTVGMFGLFTFITPLLTTVSGIPSERIPLILLLFGLGATIGVILSGRLADWRLDLSIGLIFATQAIIHLSFVAVCQQRGCDLCSNVLTRLHGHGSSGTAQNVYSKRLPGCAKSRLYPFIQLTQFRRRSWRNYLFCGLGMGNRLCRIALVRCGLQPCRLGRHRVCRTARLCSGGNMRIAKVAGEWRRPCRQHGDMARSLAVCEPVNASTRIRQRSPPRFIECEKSANRYTKIIGIDRPPYTRGLSH